MLQSITIQVAHDAEANVWWVESSDLPGLNVEGATLEELQAAIPGAVLDLLDADAQGNVARDVPIELIARAHTQVRIGA